MSINICTVNVNDENEPRCNQTESTSLKHSHVVVVVVDRRAPTLIYSGHKSADFKY